MSIETVGPAKYEFQYAATLLMALTYLDDSDTRVIIEPRDGEDLTVELGGAAPGAARTVEVQVKGSVTDVSLQTLAGWLMHYPSNAAEQPLATRVTGDPHRLVLFLSGGRCTDDLRRLLIPLGAPLAPHERSGFVRDQLPRVQEALRGQAAQETNQSTALEQRRAAHRTSLAWEREELLDLSRRVLIVEQLTSDRIRRETEEVLRRRRVPAACTGDVLRALTDDIRAARDDRADCMPAVRRTVAAYAEPRIFDSRGHVARAEEDTLLGDLRGQNVLLLTGHGQCGKTHLARALVQRCQNDGHEAEVTGDLDEAARFLRRGGPEDRVCLLDDPLPPSPAPRMWKVLADLVTQRAPHRRLVVTCRAESLRLARGPDPVAWALDGVGWYDLTLRDPAEAVRLWDVFAAAAGVMEPGRSRLREHLQRLDAATLLQPGQLRYLARNPPNSPAVDDWERTARFDARDLAVEIGHDVGASKLLSALGLTATHLRPVRLEHLAFVLSPAEERPGLEADEGLGKTFAFGADVPPPAPFPAYAQAYTLEQTLADALDALERRGIVACNSAGAVFAHPDFLEAARILLVGQPTTRTDWILTTAERAIGCLSASAGAVAVRALLPVHAAAPDVTRRERITELLRSSQRSIFPEVRDVGMRALLEILPGVSETVREEVLKRCEHFYADAEEILWHDGRPWLNPQEHLDGLRSFLADRADVSASAAPAAHQLVTPQQAWEAVQHARDPAILERCLQFDEVFIRRRAAERLFAHDPCASEGLVRHVLADDGAVVAAALKSAVSRWRLYEPDCRATLTQLFADAVAREPVAVAVAPILWRFYHRLPHDDGGGEAELWRLWGALFPPVIDASPPYAWAVDDSKLGYVAEQALRFLDDDTAWRVAEAWERWIARALQRDTPRGEALDVARYVLLHTGTDATRRGGWLARLLGSQDTALCTVTLTTCLAFWGELGAAERDDVLHVLGSERSDAAWLKAVALTARSVPPEVAQLVTGDPEALGRSAEYLRRAMPAPVLRRCIWIQTGRSNLFGWLGLGSESTAAPWSGVLTALRDDPSAPEFDDTWIDELENPDEGRSLAQFKRLFETATPELRLRVFKHLLASTCRVVSSPTAAYWKAVWDLASEEERTAYAREAMRSAEQLSYENRHFEPFRDSRILEAFFREIPGDHLVFELARFEDDLGLTSDHEADDDSARKARANAGKILVILAKRGFRTLWALDLAEDLAKRTGDAAAERAVADEHKRFFALISVRDPTNDDALLGDWVFTRQR